jgi:hypothetical protein
VATLKDTPGDATRRYAARILLRKEDAPLAKVVHAAKVQLGLKNINDFAGSLSRMLLVAAHDKRVK